MNRLYTFLCTLAASGCTGAAIAQDVTVSVAGVVVDEANLRIDEAVVELIGGTALTRDPTRKNGVYNLTKGGIDERLHEVAVRCRKSGYHEEMILVQLEDATSGIRRAKARDITLRPAGPAASTRKVAEERLTAALRTAELKVRFKLADADTAQREVVDRAAEIAAGLPEDAAGWEAIARRATAAANSGGLVKPDTVTKLAGEASFQGKVALLREESQRSQARIQRQLLEGSALDADTLEKLLALPPSSIPENWLHQPELRKHLGTINSEYLQDGRFTAQMQEAMKANDQLRPWLSGGDRRKQLLFYEQLKRSSLVSSDQKGKVNQRIEQLQP